MPNDAIHIGNLDRRVSVVKYSDTQSETGAPAHAEETVITVWAAVKFVSGNEDVEGKVISLNIRNYIMRYFPEIVTEGEQYWIKDLKDGGEFNIHHVEQIGRNEYVVCKASRRE